MSLKTKFFKMLGELDETERQQLKALFETEEEPEQETAQDEQEEAAIAPETETEAAETAPQEPAEDVETVEDSEGEPEEDGEKETPAPIAAEEAETEMPAMTKAEEPAKAQPATDDNGEELPVDYGTIVEALNAKILALEAENAKLRQKTDGAFGFGGKPSAGVKVNPLYDDDVSDIHFKR